MRGPPPPRLSVLLEIPRGGIYTFSHVRCPQVQKKGNPSNLIPLNLFEVLSPNAVTASGQCSFVDTDPVFILVSLLFGTILNPLLVPSHKDRNTNNKNGNTYESNV